MAEVLATHYASSEVPFCSLIPTEHKTLISSWASKSWFLIELKANWEKGTAKKGLKNLWRKCLFSLLLRILCYLDFCLVPALLYAGPDSQQRDCSSEMHAVDPALVLRDVPKRAGHQICCHGDSWGPESKRRWVKVHRPLCPGGCKRLRGHHCTVHRSDQGRIEGFG